MTNQKRAEEVMRGAYHSPHLSPMHHCEVLAQALDDAGLLMPDLPDVESDGSIVEGGGVGALYPRNSFSIPHVVIFGNPTITPHTQASSDNDNIVAIRADQIDHMIATLITARNLMHKRGE